MDHGPGVFVGPVVLALGVLLVVFRRAVGARLSRVLPDGELVGSERVAVLGAASVLGGGLALIAGLGWLDWWPL